MRNVILSQRTQQELLNAHAQTNEFCTKKKNSRENTTLQKKIYMFNICGSLLYGYI